MRPIEILDPISRALVVAVIGLFGWVAISASGLEQFVAAAIVIAIGMSIVYGHSDPEVSGVECGQCSAVTTVERGLFVDVHRCTECPSEGARGPAHKIVATVRSRRSA